jgi:hypothetical protein
MVRFNEESFTIEVRTGGNPVEDWMCLHVSLCDIIRSVRSDTMADETFWATIELLQSLQPEWEVARKMTDK